MKIAKSLWKVFEECVSVCEGVSEIVWEFHQWACELKYMLFDTQHVKIGPKWMKIAQGVWKVGEESVRVCEGACESVWKYHQWAFQLEYMLFDT